MRGRLFAAISAALLILNLCGCYDSSEIDSFANVIAVGIEPCPGGSRFTFAIADAGGFDDSAGDGSKSGVICCVFDADSIENAIVGVNRSLSKRLSFSHMSISVLSEGADSRVCRSALMYFEAMPDIRPQTLICVSEVKPSEYLEKISPGLEVNPEKYFLNIFLKSDSCIPVLRLSDYTNALYCSKDVAAPVISGDLSGESVGEQDVSTAGAAVIHGGKIVDNVENIALWAVLNSTKITELEYKGSTYVIKSVSKPEIFVDVNAQSPVVRVNLKIKSADGFADAEFISSELEALLTDFSKRGCDILGFADAAKKCFIRQKDFDNYDWQSHIKRARFSINTQIVS